MLKIINAKKFFGSLLLKLTTADACLSWAVAHLWTCKNSNHAKSVSMYYNRITVYEV
jgi:hypothetical protein